MSPGCFFCGVDSTQLIMFFALVVGSGVLSLICFIFWGVSSGHLQAETHLGRAALDAEGITDDDVEDGKR